MQLWSQNPDASDQKPGLRLSRLVRARHSNSVPDVLRKADVLLRAIRYIDDAEYGLGSFERQKESLRQRSISLGTLTPVRALI